MKHVQNNQMFAFTRGYFWGIRPIIRKPHIICAVILVNPCFPNFSQKKAVLQNYLTQHNIPFSATDTNKVLYEKIKQKKTPVVYKTDKIANLHGHRNTKSQPSIKPSLRVPACKTIKRLPLPEGIFGASFGSHI
jgi:hypothetical protein